MFFPLQMLRFSALCGQIWQKFWGSYDLRSSSKFIKFLLIWSTQSWETQHLKAKKHKPKFEFRTLLKSHGTPKPMWHLVSESNFWHLIRSLIWRKCGFPKSHITKLMSFFVVARPVIQRPIMGRPRDMLWAEVGSLQSVTHNCNDINNCNVINQT